MPRPDLIVAGLPTVDAALVLQRYARQRSIPFVVDVRDEWPEVIVKIAPPAAQPFVRLGLHRQFRKARAALSGAQAVLGVTRRQLDYGLKIAGRSERPGDRVFYLGFRPNAFDRSLVDEGRRWLVALGVRAGARIFAFVGSMSPIRPLDQVLQAARNMVDRADAQFVLCGTGEDLQRYRREAADLPNVLFPGWVDGPKMGALLEMSSVALAPYRSGVNFSLPIKMFEYMAAGLPIVTSCDGEIRSLIEEHDVGRFYEASDTAALEAALRELEADRAAAEAMGRRNAQLFDDRFSHDRLFPEMESHLSDLAES